MMVKRVLALIMVLSLISSGIVIAGDTNQIKIVVKENPSYFNVIITDSKVINETKEFLKNSTNLEEAKSKLLLSTLKTIVSNPSALKPVDILFTKDSVVFEYTYNKQFVYENSRRLVLPEISFKSKVPLIISKEFVSKCALFVTSETNSTCLYKLKTNIQNVSIVDKSPRIEYSKKQLNLASDDVYIFVDSSGNVLIVSPEKFNLGIDGKCSIKKFQSDNGEYTIYTCKHLNSIDFSSLPQGEFEVFIIYNSDNTKIFKINDLSYKIVTYLRPNVVVKEETVKAKKILNLYFEIIKSDKKDNYNSTMVFVIVGVILLATAIGVVILRRRSEEEDIFE